MSKRTYELLLIAGLITGVLRAANDPFLGNWKLNPSKSTLIDYMKVESLGGNKYALDLGGGAIETIVTDGTYQPGLQGTTLSVTIEGPVNWKVVRKKGGDTLVTGIWTLSQDGNTLSDHFTANRPGGSTFTVDYVYKRTTAGAGFAGTWVSTSEPHSASELQIQPYEGDGLSFIDPAQKMTQNLKFDGKDYPVLGPNVPAGAAFSGRRLSDHSLEITDKMGETRQIDLSADLKTLTMTVRRVAQSKPNVLVFDRE
ncbi:MAG TPA: hypothetical protein VI455_11390 [Terriglobia bacterium]